MFIFTTVCGFLNPFPDYLMNLSACIHSICIVKRGMEDVFARMRKED